MIEKTSWSALNVWSTQNYEPWQLVTVLNVWSTQNYEPWQLVTVLNVWSTQNYEPLQLVTVRNLWERKKNLVFAESYLRDRPFKLKGGLWFFVSFRTFFSDNTRVRIFIFFVGRNAIFFQNLTLDYMTKTLNQIIFFFLHQNQNIFFSNVGNQNIFFRKKP